MFPQLLANMITALKNGNDDYFPSHDQSLSSCLLILHYTICSSQRAVNPLNAELNPICYLLALLAHHFLHVSRIRVKSLTLRLLKSYIHIYIYIYMERLFLMFLDHTQRRTTVGRTPLGE